MADLSLKLDDNNSLELKVDIATSDPQNEAPNVRIVCEADDMSYTFKGEYTDDNVVRFNIPPMKGMLAEGVYPMKVELIMGHKYFVPMEAEVEFRETVRVVAEVVQRKPEETKVTASFVKKEPIVETKAKPAPKKKSVKKVTTVKPKPKPKRSGRVSRPPSLKDQFKKGLL